MSFALETFVVDDYVNPASTVSIGNGDYIEFSGYVKSGNDSAYRIFGDKSSFNHIVSLTASGVLVRPTSSTGDMTFSTGYTQPAVGQDFTVRIKKLSDFEWECVLNGVSLGTQTTPNIYTLNVSQFFNLNTSGQAFIGGAYYIEACTDGTGTATNRWESLTGTGSTWVDQIGTNDATLSASFPTDDSQWVSYDASAPTVTTIDGDNAVNQYQQGAVIALSDFTESITSVTLNGVTAPIQSQVVGTSVTVDLPGSLATGTYDLVVSGATETDTLTGVSYTQTHPRPAFDGLVDSNSILSGQSYTADTYFRFVTSFSNGTLDTAAGDAAEWAGDIADYYTPNAGFTGDDTASIEFLYSDGTTSDTVGVTISVVDGAVDTWPFGKGINPAATKNWTWGRRHPKTNMRVRIYK